MFGLWIDWSARLLLVSELEKEKESFWFLRDYEERERANRVFIDVFSLF
jgi:hypothetical protein